MYLSLIECLDQILADLEFSFSNLQIMWGLEAFLEIKGVFEASSLLHSTPPKIKQLAF